ncbi:hypothetical protein KL86DYS1_11764 [uncultured Dysgonomonas sp.]|uniref:Uncharacterized protein n=1 Tax=uncultured Dysgonomonas sp. TaxID=206096 RepID=A0A212JBV9_9BACT|nr:hypothetical protein KL86DYS1_11764 [uncultured Dysgonomonas sp.]
MVTTCSEVAAFGKRTLIAAGVTIVDIIRKNNNRKNIISFNEEV